MTDFGAAMRNAARLTRSYRLLDATRVIQDALAKRQSATSGHQSTPALPLELPNPEKDLEGDSTKASVRKPAAARADVGSHPPDGAAPSLRRPRQPLGEVVRILREGRLSTARSLDRAKPSPPVKVEGGAQYLTRSFSSAAGRRSYKLYIPANVGERPRGLILMLHGCNQNPDDFAIGTAMNELAGLHGLLIAYPHQTRADNPSGCWNWFRPGDQLRGQGEPAILAGIASELASEFDLGREQMFAAGLSAGGAMAMVLGETYADLFGAVGIHSGLDYRAACDVASAFAAMRGSPGSQLAPGPAELKVRTIVFHGSSDATVHPCNADRISARVRASSDQDEFSTQRGAGYTRATLGPEQAPLFEKWSVDGLGHAWSGGNSAGSFTDARGPSASAEMVRFFVGSSNGDRGDDSLRLSST